MLRRALRRLFARAPLRYVAHVRVQRGGATVAHVYRDDLGDVRVTYIAWDGTLRVSSETHALGLATTFATYNGAFRRTEYAAAPVWHLGNMEGDGALVIEHYAHRPA